MFNTSPSQVSHDKAQGVWKKFPAERSPIPCSQPSKHPLMIVILQDDLNGPAQKGVFVGCVLTVTLNDLCQIHNGEWGHWDWSYSYLGFLPHRWKASKNLQKTTA